MDERIEYSVENRDDETRELYVPAWERKSIIELNENKIIMVGLGG